MVERIAAGKERRVRRQCERRRSNRMLEDHAFARDPIERRRRAGGAAICPESIGACGVERDDEEVQVLRSYSTCEFANLDAGGCGGFRLASEPVNPSDGDADREYDERGTPRE